MPAALTFELDRRVLIVGLTVAIASAILSSLLPAWRATRGDLAATLKDASGSMPRRSRLWARHGLVCGQVALSLVLVTVSVWLYRGTRLMLANGPGYRTEQLLMVNLDPALARYNDGRAREFFRALTEKTRALPGVASMALTSDIPLGADARDIVTVAPEGYRFPAGSDSITVQGARVDEGFFATMDIPIVSGRAFASTDTADTPHVAVVNTTFANRYWPGQNALGKRIRVKERNEAWVEIVGVAPPSITTGLPKVLPTTSTFTGCSIRRRRRAPRCSCTRTAMRPRWRRPSAKWSAGSMRACQCSACAPWRTSIVLAR